MKTYSFSTTNEQGEKVTFVFEAENLNQALAMYRQRLREMKQ